MRLPELKALTKFTALEPVPEANTAIFVMAISFSDLAWLGFGQISLISQISLIGLIGVIDRVDYEERACSRAYCPLRARSSE